MKEMDPRLRRAFLVCLPLLVAANFYLYRAVATPSELTVHVLDVGKGTAILIQSPNGKTVLVDAGADASILRALGTALPFWQRRIDALVLTSVSAGTSGGAPEVLERYRVGELIRPQAKGTAAQEAALAAAASAEPGLAVETVSRGDRLSLGDGATIDVLWPPATPAPLHADTGQLVLLLSSGSASYEINESLPAQENAWLAKLDADAPAPALLISSSTPPGVIAAH